MDNLSSSHTKEHEDHRFGEVADLPKADGRKCTDMVCLLVLFLFWAALGGIVGLAYTTAGAGGMLRIYKGVQLDGKVCGLAEPDGPGAAYNKQWFYAYDTLSTNMLCVKECPTSMAAAVLNGTNTKTCGRVFTNTSGTGAWRDFCKNKPSIGTKTLASGVLNVCTPRVNVNDVAAVIDNGQSMFDVTSIMQSLSSAWWTLFVSGVFSLLFAFVFLGLIRCGGRFVVYFLLFMTILIFAGAGTGSYGMSQVSSPAACVENGKISQFGNWFGKNMTCTCAVPVGATVANGVAAGATCASDEAKVYMWVGITAWSIGGLVLLVMCFMFKSVKVASAIMNEAAGVMFGMKQMLFIPLYKYFVITIFLIIWASIMNCILAGSPLATTSSVSGSDSTGQEYNVAVYTMVTQWPQLATHIFCLLWMVQLIKASMDFTIGVAVSHWYFADVEADGKRVPKTAWPVFKGIGMVFRYHMGSLALGSFLVAVVQMARLCIEYVDQKTKDANSKILKAVMCMCKCCLWCLECCLKFITRQAYLMMAITGDNFCGSAKKMFFLNLRNIAKVTVTHGVTHAVLFFGKVFAVGLSVLCCFFIITSSGAFETTVEPLFPCLLCAIVAFLVASIILKLFSTTTEALLMCFLVDQEVHGEGTHGPPSLRKCIDDLAKTAPEGGVEGNDLTHNLRA